MKKKVRFRASLTRAKKEQRFTYYLEIRKIGIFFYFVQYTEFSTDQKVSAKSPEKVKKKIEKSGFFEKKIPKNSRNSEICLH